MKQGKNKAITLFDIYAKGCVFEYSTNLELYRIQKYGGELAFFRMIIASLKKGDIFFDIGANAGVLSVHSSYFCQQVYAFEPDPYYNSVLTRNVARNQRENISVIDWGVYQEKGETKLFTDNSGGISPSLQYSNHESQVKINLNSIDNGIEDDIIPFPDVIKIDIEGAEYHAILGMNKLLQSENGPRLIFLEIHPTMLEKFESSESEVFQKLKDYSYTPVFITQRDNQIHAVFIRGVYTQIKEPQSTILHQGPPFSRTLASNDIHIFQNFWANCLDGDFTTSFLKQCVDEITTIEHQGVGRLAGDIQDAILRSLVVNSINTDCLDVLEVGVLFGINSICMYKLCNSELRRKHFTLIDPLHGYYRPGEKDCLTKLEVDRKILDENLSRANLNLNEISIIQGLSNAPEVVEKASDKRYQVIFVDGDHSYEGVKQDYEIYGPLVADNGYLIFDNYNDGTSPGVDRFINELRNTNSIFKMIGTSWRTIVFQRKGEEQELRAHVKSLKNTIKNQNKNLQEKDALINSQFGWLEGQKNKIKDLETIVEEKESLVERQSVWLSNLSIKNDQLENQISTFITSTIDFFRYKRDICFKDRDLYCALEMAQNVISSTPEENDFERYYHIGLALHEKGALAEARQVYQEIEHDNSVGQELKAWACFKHGELVAEMGDKAAASKFYQQALKINPNHTKALIKVSKQKGRLEVSIGKSILNKSCVEVMIENITEERLWKYYFKTDPPDYVEMFLSESMGRADQKTTIEMINRYLAEDGKGIIRCDAEINKIDEIIAETQGGKDLSVVSDKRGA